MQFKNVGLNSRIIELIDKLYNEIIIAPATTQAENYYLKSLTYSKKIEKLLSYIETIEEDIKNEIAKQ